MTDYRSEAEKFVTAFIDYVNKYDIQDFFNKKTQKMETSPGVAKLIQQAQEVFPERIGIEGTKNLSKNQVTEAIQSSDNVVDRRDEFSRKIQANGAARGLLERVLAGDEEARHLAHELIAADNGEKEFVSTET